MTILTDNSNTYYVIKVSGKIVSTQFTSQQVAETEKQKLPADTQLLAEVVPVNAAGLEILLG